MTTLVTIDFETYYDKEYSLSKMSTEAYIADPRFKVILVAAKVDDGPVEWAHGAKAIREFLHKLDIPNSGIVCHNAMFDATILQERYGLRPGFIFDTLSMAQAHIRPFTRSVSLKSCLEYCDFDGLRKGDEVHNMLGRTYASLSHKELGLYAEYCCNDVEGTYKLFRHLKPMFPKSEFVVMDMTHRMYLEPRLELDAGLLAEIQQAEISRKTQLVQSLAHICTKDVLMSNDKFAALLVSRGVEPPRKISLTTGKPTYAFAKGDPEFKALQEEYADDEQISAILEARLGVKSTIAETRAGRLLEIAQRFKRLRVPLGYYAAHTGRYGGTQKINLQNLGRIDKKLGRRQLRYALRAPKGCVVLGADLSQIEARIVAWLAGCQSLVSAFAGREDVYSQFASSAYRQETIKDRSPEDNIRRFVGKTCILGLGYGMGADKLQGTLAKAGVHVTAVEAQRFVHTYRGIYPQIPSLWYAMDRAIPIMAHGQGQCKIGPLLFGRNMVVLPNDMPIYYHNLSVENHEWWYVFGRETRKLFGGKLTENIVQALARIIIMENMLMIRKKLGLQPVLQVHDELDYVVPEAQAERYAQQIGEIMAVPPTWAATLPVAAEVHWGPTFGDVK